jgi:hypothetical protein
MTDIKIVKSWDAMPPVLYDGDEAFSTRLLEKQYRELEQRNKELEAKYLKAVDLADRASDSALEYATKYAKQDFKTNEIKAQALESLCREMGEEYVCCEDGAGWAAARDWISQEIIEYRDK